MTDTTNTQPKFTGKHMLATMICFYAVIITVNLIMVYFALNSWSGLLTDHSYKENQVFDQKTAALQKMQSLGVQLKPSYQNGEISIEARDKTGQLIKDGNLSLEVGRVIHERDDQTLILTGNDEGRYAVKHILGRGRWQLKTHLKLNSGAVWKKTYILEVEGAK